MIPDYHFGESLKKYLTKQGIKQAHIAKKIGVTTASFSNYLEVQMPRHATKMKILEGLGITESELFGIENKEETELERKYQELERKLMIANEELLKYQRKEIKELQVENSQRVSHP